MKNTIAFSLGALLLLSACSNDMKDAVDNVPVTQSGLQYMEFTASAGTDTRTQLTSDNKVVWQAGDAISIFEGTGNRKFTTRDSGENVVFGGNAANASTYYALYPYQESARLTGNVIKNVTLPSEQTAKAGSFDAASNLSVATASSDLQLAFKNVGSLVRFSVSNSQASKVRKVKLTSHDATAVLTATVDITLGNQPTATPTAGQQPSATMIAANGLETGKYYYFAVLPSTLSSGFSLTFYDNEGKIWQKDYTENNAARSSILKLDAIEIGTFTNSLLTNKNLIAAAEESTGMTFTKNADGSVSLLDNDNYKIAMAVTRLDISYKKDPSICEEIGVFGNLEYLNCVGNGITNLDLSKNVALTYLNCAQDGRGLYNQLTSLDLSKNTALAELHCEYTKLKSLIISNCTKLTWITCQANELTKLDLSNNTELTTIACYYNQLTSLDLTKNTALIELNCSSNELTNLDLSMNMALTKLSCGENQLASLDLTKHTALTYLNISGVGSGITSIDLSKNTKLTKLYCYNTFITEFNLSKNTELTELSCGLNPLSSLDLSNNRALTKLNCEDSNLTSLDLSNNTELTDLNCSYNKLSSLDISNNNQIDWNYLYVGAQTDSSNNDQVLNLYVNAEQHEQSLPVYYDYNKNVNILLKSVTDATGTHEGFEGVDY